jgi:DNA-binding MarR family transcriptional regulator
MIDRLERAGFVTRTADPNDRRRVLVNAVQNKKAFKKIAKLYEPLGKAFGRLVTRYSDDELAIIVDFMDLANDMIRETIDTLPDRTQE